MKRILRTFAKHKDEEDDKSEEVVLVKDLQGVQQEFDDGMSQGQVERVQSLQVASSQEHQGGDQPHPPRHVHGLDVAQPSMHFLHVWHFHRDDEGIPGLSDLK